MMVAAALIKLAGPYFWCLRLVSMVSAIACALLLYRIMRLSGCSSVCAAIAPAFFLGFSPTFLWANIGRPDILAVALALGGFERVYTCYLKGEDSSAWPTPCIVAGLLLSLSCYAKQTSIVCIATAFLFLLWTKRWRSAITCAVTFVLCFGILTGITQAITGGFIQNITIFGKTPWDSEILARYMHFMSDADQLRGEILLLVVLYCMFWKKQETSVPERLPYLFFGLSLAQMIYIMGLPGSNGNHAIFPLLALSWWLALKAQTLPKAAGRAVLISSLLAVPSLVFYLSSIVSPLPKDPKVLDSLDLRDKLVLSEDPYLNFLSHSQPAMIDCAVFTSVWKKSPDKLNALANSIKKKEFAAIIINCQDSKGGPQYFWPDTIPATVRENYHEAGKLSGEGICQTLWLP
jgi:hypothetical protein